MKRKPGDEVRIDKWKVGDTVRVKGFRPHAKIESFYRDIEGGLKLDRAIGGFYSWNVADLAAPPKQRRKRKCE